MRDVRPARPATSRGRRHERTNPSRQVMSGIAFEHVSKVFSDGTAAVAGLDLRVSDGEFCVLLGPSGCGKSTVLRLVAGLEEVTRGVIRIGDRAVNDVPPGDRGVAMVFESFALYPHMTVAEN